MSIKLTTVRVEVVSAGTAVTLSSIENKRSSFTVTADPAATGTIFVGDSTVLNTTKNGIPIAANESAIFEPPAIWGTDELLDLELFFVDSTSSGDFVIVSYYERVQD